MSSQDMKTSNKETLEVLVPKGLIRPKINLKDLKVTLDGLCALKIVIENGLITNIEAVEKISKPLAEILLPRFAEPHAHLDKAFTWSRFPNLEGTYQGALKANLKEHQTRTITDVSSRIDKSVKLAIRNGVRALRSHIDIFGSIENEIWNQLVAIKIKWEELIDLQFVAMPPLEFWETSQGLDLAKQVANQGGLLGGVLLPPFDSEKARSLLLKMISFADDFGCGIDLHIDESTEYPGEGLMQLIKVLDQIDCSCEITCSHLSSMSLLPPERIKFFADKLSNHRVNVIALPLTNFWLLRSAGSQGLTQRPIAPVANLQNAGVNVAIGGDNVQDPWFPSGNLDPIQLMSSSFPLLQIAPWQKLGIEAYITSSARLMGLKWDGVIREGSPADFVVLKASNWSEVLSQPPKRKIMIKGKWLQEGAFSIEPKN